MDGIGLILLTTLVLTTLVGGIGILLWCRRRAQRLQVTAQSVRCPIHDCRADLAVQTDPAAQSSRQYIGVLSCSLLSDAAVALPERTGYLADGPPCRVLLDPARSFPAYATKVPCRQPCVFALNATAVSGADRAVPCTFGDAMELARQTIRNPRISRLLWSSSC